MFQSSLGSPREQRSINPAPQNAPQNGWHNPAIKVVRARVQESPRIACVAAQCLIAAFAGKHDSDALSGEPRNEIERHAGWPHNRFILMPDQSGQDFEKLIAAEPHFVMSRPQVISDSSGVREFAEGFFTVAHRESLDVFF